MELSPHSEESTPPQLTHFNAHLKRWRDYEADCATARLDQAASLAASETLDVIPAQAVQRRWPLHQAMKTIKARISRRPTSPGN